MTVGKRLAELKKSLKAANIESWSIDASLIMMHAMGFNKMQLVTHDTDEVTPEKEEIISKFESERLSNKPMQYILGHCEFMGLDFDVNESTLIPRPDTEILVENAIEIIEKYGCKTVLDIGTGSGAIAVSLAKYTNAEVTAVDISPKALETAKHNAEKNGVNVNFILSDLFENINTEFDVIVSNPPYIETAVVETLESNVKDYEPRTALDGGEDGLYFYRKITQNAHRYLTDCCGALAFEIGYNQAEALKKIFKTYSFDNILIKNDLSGLNRLAIGFKM
jgi:release factor glutamine methyltransferase